MNTWNLRREILAVAHRWHWVIALVIQWVTMKSPRDFGFYRSRWTCGTIVALLEEDHDVRTNRETVRCWLHEEGLVWRRPRPVAAR